MPNSRPNNTSRTEGERRYLTILFSDIVGSVSIAERLDPEEWHALVTRYNDVAARAVTRFAGHIGQFLGDGVLAFFGWPHAIEHAAEGAVRAALFILQEMAEVNKEAAMRGQPRLSLRIGVHAGPVVVTESGEVFGDPVNVAARVQSEARTDTVFVTDTIRNAIADQFEFMDEGLHTLKGVSNPLKLYRVAGSSRLNADIAFQPATSFVNREAEMAAIMSRWHLARRGQGQCVTILGDAGIGKSRLVSELRRKIIGTKVTWRRSGGAEFFQNTPFFAVSELLGRAFPVGAKIQRPSRHDRFERILRATGLSDDTVPLVERILDAQVASVETPDGNDPPPADDRYRQLVTAIAALAVAEAKRRPCVLVIEDLHWLDHSTLACLEALRLQLQSIPMLLILTARPEYVPPSTSRANEAVLHVEPLDRRHVIEIVQNASVHRPLSDEVVDHIVARSDGVPLFAQELAFSICDKRGAVVESELPRSLADSLAARLDRLGSAREVAQIAAVISSDFSTDLIGHLLDKPPSEVGQALRALVDARVLDSRGPPSNPLYAFAHSLIKDAAYATLLKSRRRTLHARVARAMSDEFATFARDKPEVIARHWEAAEDWQAAANAWQSVASRALSRAAFRETKEAYDRSLGSLSKLPDAPQKDRDELAARRRLVSVLQITHGYSAPETVLEASRSRDLSVKLGEESREIGRLISEWAALSSAGSYVESSRLADKLLSLAKQDGRAEKLADAYMVQVTTQYRLANLKLAEKYFEEGEPYFSAPRFRARLGAIAQTFGNASQISWIVGNVDRARKYVDHALDVAKERDNPYDRTFSAHMATMFAVLAKEYSEAERSGAEAIKLSDEHHFPQFECIARIAYGKALVGLGRPRDGRLHIEHGLAGMSKSGSRVTITLYLTWLAEAHHRLGDSDGALQAIEQALSANEQERVYRPESLRVRAELRASTGREQDALSDLHEAIRIARDMDAKNFELRARVSLCRVTRAESELRHLEQLLSRFSSGFETPDFKEAQSLIRRHGAPRREPD